jgi:hypothetical protein
MPSQFPYYPKTYTPTGSGGSGLGTPGYMGGWTNLFGTKAGGGGGLSPAQQALNTWGGNMSSTAPDTNWEKTLGGYSAHVPAPSATTTSTTSTTASGPPNWQTMLSGTLTRPQIGNSGPTQWNQSQLGDASWMLDKWWKGLAPEAQSRIQPGLEGALAPMIGDFHYDPDRLVSGIQKWGNELAASPKGSIGTEYGYVSLTPEQKAYSESIRPSQRDLYAKTAAWTQTAYGAPGSNPQQTPEFPRWATGGNLDYSAILNPYKTANEKYLATPEGQTWSTQQAEQKAQEEAARQKAAEESAYKSRLGENERLKSEMEKQEALGKQPQLIQNLVSNARNLNYTYGPLQQLLGSFSEVGGPQDPNLTQNFMNAYNYWQNQPPPPGTPRTVYQNMSPEQISASSQLDRLRRWMGQFGWDVNAANSAIPNDYYA